MIEPEWVCLELLKTRGWEARDRDDDLLDADLRFLAWSRQQRLLDAGEARRLREVVRESPPWWGSLRHSIRELRLLLHRIFVRVAEDALPDADDLAALEEVLSARGQEMTMARAESGRLAWRWKSEFDAPLTDLEGERLGRAVAARILGGIARSAADLLTSGSLERVKICDAHDCGWFFVDVSRNRSRRWCDMAGCGNRVKARRYRERHA